MSIHAASNAHISSNSIKSSSSRRFPSLTLPLYPPPPPSPSPSPPPSPPRPRPRLRSFALTGLRIHVFRYAAAPPAHPRLIASSPQPPPCQPQPRIRTPPGDSARQAVAVTVTRDRDRDPCLRRSRGKPASGWFLLTPHPSPLRVTQHPT